MLVFFHSVWSRSLFILGLLSPPKKLPFLFFYFLLHLLQRINETMSQPVALGSDQVI